MKKKAGQKGTARTGRKRSMKDLPAKSKGGAAVKGGQTISGQGSGDPIPTESVRSRLR